MFQPATTVLLVIDVQGNLAAAMHDREQLFQNLSRLIRGVNILDIPVLLTEQMPDKIGATQPFITELLPGTKPLVKFTFSCCGSPEFMHALAASGRRQVLICGIETHVCVYQTAFDLKMRGFGTSLVADAVSSRSAVNTAVAVEKMKSLGITLTTVEMIAMELIRDAKHPKFKDILNLIK